MKTKLIPLFAILLASLLLCAAACGNPESDTSDTAANSATDANVAGNPSETLASSDESTTENLTEAATALPLYPGDIELNLPDMQETINAVLSLKDGKLLGFSAFHKPQTGDIIESYTDFQALYGTVEGIDDTFFETHVFRLAHTAQSSSSTRYAVESVTPANDEIKVEIIEQHAAMATRDLRYHFVFVAVEKAHVETPLAVHITGVQLAS